MATFKNYQMRIQLLVMLASIFITKTFAQKDTIQLKEVLVTATNRIDLPFDESSRTITVINSTQINQSAATNVADLLQLYAGIDVRKRGLDGMQSDLYIRGGSFDQTLVLIDGIKMDDAQTGHHAMNAMISIENIERIEIIKGAAARIYGQNAFVGAVNIVTKKISKDNLTALYNIGSYDNSKLGIGFGKNSSNAGFQLNLEKQQSDGYRFNTDFDNLGIFLKGFVGKYKLISFFNERKFGANGFYANPNFKDQYEETQTNLVGITTKYNLNNTTVSPQIYWRRNQDMYLFLRHNPAFYRNMHISNKLGVEVNLKNTNKLGLTGFGIDINKVFLSSNNLGKHDRLVLTSFLEHRFVLVDDNLDITPGVAFSHYDDFGSKAFPGIDIGYRFTEKLKTYANIGYTYRIPTYTDLYYKSSVEQGNPDLKPESAITQELGLHYTTTKLNANLAVFNRNSSNLIDWTKDNATDKWQARNFSEVTTKGIETSLDYQFKIADLTQKLQINYTYIDDSIKNVEAAFTRYSINSLKHQFNTQFTLQYFPFLAHTISYKYNERTNGENYDVVDSKLMAKFNSIELFVTANNIFDEIYTETNLVPMPKANFMIGFKYSK